MAGAIFLAGEIKVRPGAYFRVVNAGAAEPGVVAQGRVACLFRANWGPLGLSDPFEGGDPAVTQRYGVGGSTGIPRFAFHGGAREVLPVRVGSGGTPASTKLKDTATPTPADVVTITAKYPGSRELSVTIRDSLSDVAKRELLVMEGTTVLQTVEFPKGTNEPAALVAAVAASNSRYITATKDADGNGTLATVTQQALTGGSDPIIDGQAYSNALALLENQQWNVLVVDAEDPATHTQVAAFVQRMIQEGKRVLAVVGEPTSVAWSTRRTNAAAFNHPAVHYVGNGFEYGGMEVEGASAAAWVAGRIASAPITASLTHEVVHGATRVVGALTGPQVAEAIQSGMLVFTVNARGQVQIEKGINTLVSPPADMDAGWKKIRRTRTRYHLMDRIAMVWDSLVGKVDNTPDGRATLIQAAQGVINAMVAEGALLGGTCTEDPSNPPQGDSAWFIISVEDMDSAETIYGTLGFRF